ncbi:PstS family phosphate ABC transporter substrate-binding protein [Mucilaginibacter aquatilis]|uniref:Phosphate ABC transporter substrate-binding protein n=1 Tax=Mucilaginibacter aquatilis TaxID=1517760 RepID=A0A6I4IR94_9SPHI|nr:substrate-binding domain-containing protein [Mucilaginibacter aquatilis]MVN92454.1 phosphate ABC transporter substrate-binding protein [Mucilaginibacter aquatilis]
MSNSIKIIICSILVIVVFGMCRQQQASQVKGDDTFVKGKALFLADESFKPILDQEAYVFKALFTEAKPEFVYKSENEALKLFLEDSIRVAILSRELNPSELGILERRGLPPDVNRFAIDAITLIVNQESADTTISVKQIKDMLNGKTMIDKNIVFDNPNSSLVRYLKDFSGNKELKEKNIYALQSNKDVIKYVSEHPNSIGIVGFSWLDDPDKDYADAVSKVKIVGVKDESNDKSPTEYFKPNQTTLALKQYPLVRGLYILNSTGKMGLAAGFAAFIKSDRGQRIILKSGLLPDSIPQREMILK